MNNDLMTTNLVKHYLNCCNAALARATPLGRFWGAKITAVTSGKTIAIHVFDGSGGLIAGYTTRFVNGQFMPIREDYLQDTALALPLRHGFLEEVWNHPDPCIRDPDRLEWTWLGAAS